MSKQPSCDLAEQRVFHAAFARLVEQDFAAFAALLKQCDEERWLQWLHRHRFVGLVYEALPKRHRLRTLLRPQRIQLLQRLHHTERKAEALFAMSERFGFYWSVFKGLGMAMQRDVYAFAELRVMTDLDLLVRTEELQRALACAEACGYVCRYRQWRAQAYRRQCTYSVQYAHPQWGELDVHQGLYPDISEAATQEILSRRVMGTCLNKPVWWIDRADLLLILAVHVFRNPTPITWIWVYELHRLAQLATPKQWGQAISMARRHDLSVFLYTALHMPAQLWGWTLASNRQRDLDALWATLAWPEHWAVRHVLQRLPDPVFGGLHLNLMRRLAGRPVHERFHNWRHSFFPPLGAVAMKVDIPDQRGAAYAAYAKYTGRRFGHLWTAWRA